MKEHNHITRLILSFFMLCIIGLSLPAVSTAADPKPGDVINSSNVDQYKDYFSYFIYKYIKDGWDGFKEPVVVHVKEHEANLPPEYWFQLTEKNNGKCKLNSDGSISGHEVGLPFPEPKEPDKALKIMWNLNYRWRSDATEYRDGYVTYDQRKGGKMVSQRNEVKVLQWKNRSKITPIPEMANNPKNLQWTQLWMGLEPPTKDMVMLSWRYDDPSKSDDMWSYIPTLRRTLRMVSSERQNPVRGSTYTWDDFYGFDGKIPQYIATLAGEHKILVLMNQKTLAVGEYERGYPHPLIAGENDKWELRDVWVVDMASKNPKSQEQKKTLYILKETYDTVNSQIYDKLGNLWKGGFWSYIAIPTMDDKKGIWAASSALTDFKTRYWTGALVKGGYLNADLPQAIFQPGSLGISIQ